MHDIQCAKGGDIPRPKLPALHGIHHTRVATQQRPITTRHQNILDVQRWQGTYWWSSWCIVIPEALQQQALTAAHQSHGHIKNQIISMWICLFIRYVCRHWKPYKSCSTCLHFQQIQPREKIIHHNILDKPWGVIGADMFTLNKKNYLCIVDYHSKFPIVTRAKRCPQK